MSTSTTQIEKGTFCVFPKAQGCQAAFEKAKELGIASTVPILQWDYGKVIALSDMTTGGIICHSADTKEALLRIGYKEIPHTEFLDRMENKWGIPSPDIEDSDDDLIVIRDDDAQAQYDFECEQYEQLTLQGIQDDIHCWADTILPNRPVTSPLRKLQEEVAELLAQPDKVDEFADCFLVLLDAAKIAGLDANAILQACSEKMKLNRTRKWEKPDDQGVFSHVKEQLTLPQAIAKLEVEGWVFSDSYVAFNKANFFWIRKTTSKIAANRLWSIDETNVPVDQFPTAPDQLKAAIAACELLNNAKED